MLPTLSQDIILSMDLEVVLDSGRMNYSIIVGQVTMHALKIDTKMSTHEIVWEDIHRPMASCDYLSRDRMKRMTQVWKEYLKRVDAKKDSADDDSVNPGYTTDSSNTSRPGLLSSNDNSTVSTSSTRGSKSVSFADPVAEDLIQPNVALTEEESIIGGELSFTAGDTTPNNKLHSILLSPEYKPANLEEFVQNKCNNLTLQQKGKVLGVLNKHKKLFQGKRGE